DAQTKRVGGLAVDNHIELGDLLHRQVGGLLALEDAAAVDADLTIGVDGTTAVARETARRDELPDRVNGRQGMISRQLSETLGLAVEQWIDADHEPLDAQLGHSCKNRVEVAFGAGMEHMKLQPENARRCRELTRERLGIRVVR